MQNSDEGELSAGTYLIEEKFCFLNGRALGNYLEKISLKHTIFFLHKRQLSIGFLFYL
jgi:hypothetical protein